MHKNTLRKLALALAFWLGLQASALRAQIFTAPLQAYTTGTNPVDFEFRANGVMIAKGNYGVGSLLSTDNGAGTRMLWFPSLGAFRAGGVSGTTWDPTNIGQYSVAMGYNTLASGAYSTAMGNSALATGANSVAIGRGNVSGAFAVGLGNGSASGQYSVALGGSAATGSGATAMGSSTASGGQSTAIGESTASGYGSVSMGRGSAAVGSYSTAIGYHATSFGSDTTDVGISTTAYAYDEFVVGTYNIGGGNGSSWVATDPLFEIGNGTSSSKSDALVVYKNGDADFQGVVTVTPGGDIPMYSGN